MQVGMIGLGRMGANMVRRLMRGGHHCVGYARSAATVQGLVTEGMTGAASTPDLVAKLARPRAVWLMLPAGAVDDTLAPLTKLLDPGDVVVDGGNSFYQDDIRRAHDLAARGIHYLDAGVSGGIWGLERGYCLMIGGSPDAVRRLDPAFACLAPGRAAAPRTEGRPEWR
jgi:6-phosphogluconate dehydrogenase